MRVKEVAAFLQAPFEGDGDAILRRLRRLNSPAGGSFFRIRRAVAQTG